MDTLHKVVLGKNKKDDFGIKDKVGYMLGDVSSALLFNFIGSYLLVFYTDVFGISAAAVGTLMAVSRVWDAINDPMMGVIVDKRKNSLEDIYISTHTEDAYYRKVSTYNFENIRFLHITDIGI